MCINMLFKRSIIIQTPLSVGGGFEFKPRLACGVIEAKRPGIFALWQTNLKIQHPPVGFQASRLHFPTLFADLDLLNCQSVNAKSETKPTTTAPSKKLVTIMLETVVSPLKIHQIFTACFHENLFSMENVDSKHPNASKLKTPTPTIPSECAWFLAAGFGSPPVGWHTPDFQWDGFFFPEAATFS